MAIFDTYSNFNKDANFSLVKIGADAPVLEVELNEMQQIQRERLRNTLKLLFFDGVRGLGKYEYNANNSLLTITDEVAIINGEILQIPKGQVIAKEGETIYLEVWEEEVSFSDTIPLHGNCDSDEVVFNYLLDSRVGTETSRRVQVLYRISTTLPNERSYIILGKIQGNDFTLLADSVIQAVGHNLDKESLIPLKYVTINSLNDETKYMVSVSHKGELITEIAKEGTPSSPVIVLKDINDGLWRMYVNEKGEVTTKSVNTGVPSPSVYLQAPNPYALIFKLGVTTTGELTTSPICELDLIQDNHIDYDTTWSSFKISKMVSDLTLEIKNLKNEVKALKKQLEGVNK